MPYLLLSLAALFWGGNYVVGHELVIHADPVILSTVRWMLTALLLCTIYKGRVSEQWKDIMLSWKIIAFLSLCGQVLFPLTLYIGLQSTSSLNAAIYLSTTPALVLIINRYIFHEKISAGNIFGVILSSLGVVWLIMQGNMLNAHAFSHFNKGDIWTIGSAASWAVYCSFLRLKPKKINGNAFVSVSAAIGAMALIPFLLFTLIKNGMPSPVIYMNKEFISGMLYLIIFPSWLSYLLWNSGINSIGATRGEIFSHIIPLSGGLLSICFLKMQIHSFHVVSALFIICGIILCSKSMSKENTDNTEAIKGT